MNDVVANTDTREGIFDVLYKCRVPVTATKTLEQIKQFGMYSTGDKNLDKAQSRALTTTFLSIAAMTNLHRNGASISIVDYNDIKKIYDAISRHLVSWKNQLDNSVNPGNAPIDDLIALDHFAVDIYEHAKYQFDKTALDSLNIKYLSSIVSFNRGNFFSNKPAEVKVDGELINKPPPEVYPKRDSYGEFFKSRLPRSSIWK